MISLSNCLVPRRYVGSLGVKDLGKASKTQRHKGRLKVKSEERFPCFVFPITPCAATSLENPKNHLGTRQLK